ncbi:MAG: hypothetical protein M3265_05700 [Actinomycetota bacterium]|jgi:hypothetical protein|nr:hypothetical protein [Actinomycetota bacterium]
MDATLLLCDFAEAVNGKLYVMGGGWNVLFAGGQPVNTALAILVVVPWDQTNQKHELAIELLTDDGEPVEVGGQQVAVSGEFEVGRPPGVKPGTSMNTPFVWNFNGLVLDPGGYEWKLAIDGDPVTSRPFQVLEAPGLAT